MLLDFMRRKTKTFLYLLVPPIIIAFVAWGTTADFSGPPEQTLVEIGKTKISNRAFLDHYQMIRQAAVENLGGNLTPEIEEMLNLKQQAIDNLIQKTLHQQWL